MELLFTGGSGFFGQRVLPILVNRFSVTTIGIGKSDEIQANLVLGVPAFFKRYDYVVHAAGKAHVVPRTATEIQEFYDVNLGGTINICRALEENLPEKFIFISTVAVYGLENGDLIKETQPLNGNSPYAKSKILAEDFLLEWGKKNNVQIIILRLPLLVGENPPGNLGAMIKAIRKGYYFRIGDGSTRRSMVLAEDVGNLIASDNIKPGIFNLTDGYHPSFKEIEDAIAKQLNRRIKSMPKLIVQTACKIGDTFSFFPINSYKYEKLTSSLTFSDQKARKELSWNPRSVIDGFRL